MTDLSTLSQLRAATRKAARGAGYSEAEAQRAAHLATLRLTQGSSPAEAIRQALDRVQQDRAPADYALAQGGSTEDEDEVLRKGSAIVLLFYAGAIALAVTVFSLFA